MKVAREERGVGVLVGADSGAGGAYGSASANAGFGVLHAFDTAGMDAPAPGSNFYPNAWIHSEASIGYVDGFAVTTTETVRVTSAIRGGYVGVAQADVSNSGRLFFDPLAPGAPLTFLSGHSYVPEPETSTTLLAGLGCLGWMARHRRSWDGRKIHPPECSRHLDRSPGVPSRPGLLARALWFHEATYDTKTTDGEGQGAPGTFWVPEEAYRAARLRILGEFLLPYDQVREAAAPDEVRLAFLQSSHQAAADAAHWDRDALERDLVPTDRLGR